MNEETKLPDGLQLAVKLLAQIGNDDSDAAIAAVHDLAEEHARRLTLQHHAADQAQRIAGLEAKCDTLKRLHDAAADERDALRARLAEIEAQDPVPNDDIPFLDCPLYARPVPAQAVPDGWRLVPVEPTQGMLDAAVTDFERERHSVPLVMEVRRASWSRMIAVAPEHKV